MDDHQLLQASLDGMERLLRMFTVERYVYLLLTVTGFVLLIYSAYSSLKGGSASTELLVGLFGSSGLIAAASVRTTWFFGKAFGLLVSVIDSITRGPAAKPERSTP